MIDAVSEATADENKKIIWFLLVKYNDKATSTALLITGTDG
jgi:hypothetical protein